MTNRRQLLTGAAGIAAAALAGGTAARAQTKLPDAGPLGDVWLGSADAKVSIVEYASLTCSHCATFHSATWPELKKKYIDTGKVRLEYHEVYFDRYGLWAAMMARCGGEMRYFGITDILYDTQSDWAASDDPAAVVASLKKIGRTAGMDDATLEACMNDADMAKALVAHYETNFKADGIEGTPTFIINGETVQNQPWDELKKVLDTKVAEAEAKK